MKMTWKVMMMINDGIDCIGAKVMIRLTKTIMMTMVIMMMT